MALSRGELKGQILRMFNKTAQNPGPYSDGKLNDAVQEALDYVATEMFLADEGWQKKLRYVTTVAGQMKVDIPADVGIVQSLRYRVGDDYLPLDYFPGSDAAKPAKDSGARQTASHYEIIDNAFVFRPALSDGGTDYLEIEHMAYPRIMRRDEDRVEPHFDACMLHFVKYKSASILANTVEKSSRPWAAEEAQWYQKMIDIVTKRNARCMPIREFEG